MYKRIVIKLGTSVLTGGTRKINRARIVELVRQCAQLHEREVEVVVVTSGAIAGRPERLDYPDLPPTVASKQMLAAVGQSRLMYTWESLFEIYSIHVGQMLLTHEDFRSRPRYLNTRDMLNALLEHHIVPVINENDAVATAEIKVGDNDNLSALVALLAEADLLLLLTDQAGLFTADPRTNPDAKLIPEVRTIDESLYRLAGGSVTGLGVGGMTTKLQAADVARRAGVDVIIAAGGAENVVLRAVAGEAIGTRFPAKDAQLEKRKRWIFGGATPPWAAARGCRRSAGAHRERQQPAAGRYRRGGGPVRAAAIPSGSSVPMAPSLPRGIARYDSADLTRILGCRSDQIEAKLGYEYGPVAVHRNDLILV